MSVKQPTILGVLGQLSVMAAAVLFLGTVAVGVLADGIGMVGTVARFIVLSPLALLFAMLTLAIVLCLQVVVQEALGYA